jgi:hypothetical protein
MFLSYLNHFWKPSICDLNHGISASFIRFVNGGYFAKQPFPRFLLETKQKNLTSEIEVRVLQIYEDCPGSGWNFDFTFWPPLCSYFFFDSFTGSCSIPSSRSWLLLPFRVFCSGLFCFERFFKVFPSRLMIKQNHIVLNLLQLQPHSV